ncbi:cytochrome P450 71A1-like isoform X9 [Miscanthus floridulus]|uniref:cytochrome P450 71A1-like isoform X9 n=1 Tax=Miscanthus floridulus TaxID=154761 RepID=UPI00345B353A
MDVSPLLALLLVALLSLLLFLSTGTGRKTLGGDGRRRLPPSPRGFPILGHLPLLGPLPHRKLWAMAQAHGPVMLLRFGRVPTVVASSEAAAQEVMKTHDLAFASRPRMRMAERLVYGRDVAFVPYGEHWRQGRRVCVLHLLSQRRVTSFRHAREQEVASMLARVRRDGGGAVNLTTQIISYTNGIISRAAFGDKGGSYYDGPDGGEKLTKLFADFEGLLGTVTMGDFVPWLAWVDALMGLDAKATRTSAEMDAFLERVISDHRQRRRGGHRDGDDHLDFVDVLLDVNDDEADASGAKFDDVAIKAIILELGWNFVDPIPLDVLPAMAETGDRLAGTSAISKSQTFTALPGVSFRFVDVYEEYVPRLVSRSPRSVPKRGRIDRSSSGLPVSKKPRKPSTPSGTPVVASMLLGALVSLAEEEEDDEVPLIMRRTCLPPPRTRPTRRWYGPWPSSSTTHTRCARSRTRSARPSPSPAATASPRTTLRSCATSGASSRRRSGCGRRCRSCCPMRRPWTRSCSATTSQRAPASSSTPGPSRGTPRLGSARTSSCRSGSPATTSRRTTCSGRTSGSCRSALEEEGVQGWGSLCRSWSWRCRACCITLTGSCRLEDRRSWRWTS